MTGRAAWWTVSLMVSCLAATAAPPPGTGGALGQRTGSARHVSRHPIGAMPQSARDYYVDVYGVDDLAAQLTDAGALVRFSYRVVDAAKAQALQDRAAQPTMLDPASHAVLYIPVMEKIGPLRQSMPAKEGVNFWMAFSNKGGPVKPGHKVSVVIGPARIDGLIVQ